MKLEKRQENRSTGTTVINTWPLTAQYNFLFIFCNNNNIFISLKALKKVTLMPYLVHVLIHLVGTTYNA